MTTRSKQAKEATRQRQNPTTQQTAPTEFEIQFKTQCWFKVFVTASSEAEAERKYDEWHKGHPQFVSKPLFGAIPMNRPADFEVSIEILPYYENPAELRASGYTRESRASWYERRGWETAEPSSDLEAISASGSKTNSTSGSEVDV